MEVQTQITKCFAKCTISVQIQPNSVRRWFSLKGRDPEIFSKIHPKMTILEPFEACVVSSVKSSYLMGGCVNARTTNFRTGEKKGRGSKQTLIFNQLLEEKVLTFLTPIVKKGPLWVFSAKNHAKKKEEAAWQGSTTRVQKPRIVQGRMDSKRWDTLESISILNDTATRH